MKELTNNDVYSFLQEEIALHPNVPSKFRCHLEEK